MWFLQSGPTNSETTYFLQNFYSLRPFLINLGEKNVSQMSFYSPVLHISKHNKKRLRSNRSRLDPFSVQLGIDRSIGQLDRSIDPAPPEQRHALHPAGAAAPPRACAWFSSPSSCSTAAGAAAPPHASAWFSSPTSC
jgi:hypothetical protein